MKNTCGKFVQMAVAISVLVFSHSLMAKDLKVKITRDKPYAMVKVGDERIKITRIQDTEHKLQGSFTKTSRPCPPFCINPIDLGNGVHTAGELEVIRFMETAMYHGDGVLIDARTPAWHKKGTIPGSINVPFTVFEKGDEDPEVAELLESFGAVERDEVNPVTRLVEKTGFMDGDLKTERWDFSKAKELMLWCNGPWCGQSPRAIRALLAMGYPAKKLHYYRGGMQMWQSLGLTTVVPESE